jgi:excisionase family DNA binding protein
MTIGDMRKWQVLPTSHVDAPMPPVQPPRSAPIRAKLARATYTIEEVGELLGLSRNGAYLAAREGRLPVPVIKIGKLRFVSRAVLDRFLETGEVER